MIDCSKLSDHEINVLVVTNIIGDSKSSMIREDLSYNGCVVIETSTSRKPFAYNPCSNWSDAGQLVEDGKITLHFRNHKQDWLAKNSKATKCAYSENPKRAIAECFLMMNEGCKS